MWSVQSAGNGTEFWFSVLEFIFFFCAFDVFPDFLYTEPQIFFFKFYIRGINVRCSEITVREVFVQLSLARCVLMREREKREIVKAFFLLNLTGLPRTGLNRYWAKQQLQTANSLVHKRAVAKLKKKKKEKKKKTKKKKKQQQQQQQQQL